MNTPSPAFKGRKPSASRERARQEHRQSILAAAESVFSGSGYHDASLTAIARQARIAVGTIYLYFHDKADLYGHLLIGKMQQIVHEFEKALTSDDSPRNCLRAGMHAQFAFHDANRPFFEIFLHQHQVQSSPLHEAHWQEMETLKKRNLSLIEECIIRGQALSELRPANPRLLAVVYLGITLQMIRQCIRENEETRLVDSADLAADSFLYGAAISSSLTA